MKLETPSPELKDVPGADRAVVTHTKIPCGECFTTEYFAGETSLRMDQHVVPDWNRLRAEGLCSI